MSKINNLANSLSLYEYQRAPYGHLKYYRFDNGRMIRRNKDYDAFAHLRPFPNMLGSYTHETIKA
jgi:hypothetical protein|tara:strand:+ start:216 stop:410 length:195 start_codon:yes stop_codon:yes gene_type:complete